MIQAMWFGARLVINMGVDVRHGWPGDGMRGHVLEH